MPVSKGKYVVLYFDKYVKKKWEYTKDFNEAFRFDYHSAKAVVKELKRCNIYHYPEKMIKAIKVE